MVTVEHLAWKEETTGVGEQRHSSLLAATRPLAHSEFDMGKTNTISI